MHALFAKPVAHAVHASENIRDAAVSMYSKVIITRQAEKHFVDARSPRNGAHEAQNGAHAQCAHKSMRGDVEKHRGMHARMLNIESITGARRAGCLGCAAMFFSRARCGRT